MDLPLSIHPARNAAAATVLGMQGIHFIGPAALRGELVSLGLLRHSG